MLYFLQGLTLGFAYVAPIGVQHLFVINTGLTQPRARAYQTALIIIFFDISLALACFFGIGALMEAFPPVKMAVLLIGSLVVFYMGVQLIRAEPTLGQGRDVQVPLGKVVGIACVVTWFNPQALIDGTLLLGAFRATLSLGVAVYPDDGRTKQELISNADQCLYAAKHAGRNRTVCHGDLVKTQPQKARAAG